MYKIVVGEISQKRQENWFCCDENPYGVWEGDSLAEQICYINAWCYGDKFLRDRVDVDWGSIAWKGNKAEIVRFFQACNLDSARLENVEENRDFAVIFIESAGEF